MFVGNNREMLSSPGPSAPASTAEGAGVIPEDVASGTAAAPPSIAETIAGQSNIGATVMPETADPAAAPAETATPAQPGNLAKIYDLARAAAPVVREALAQETDVITSAGEELTHNQQFGVQVTRWAMRQAQKRIAGRLESKAA